MENFELNIAACPGCRAAFTTFQGLFMSTQSLDGLDIEEFFNKCHDENGRFCSGPGAGATGDNELRDNDGLVGRVTKDQIPAKRGTRGGSTVDPNEGTREIDGVRGYDEKGKPVPGSDAWLEAHNLTPETFKSRPYVKYEADRNDPALREAADLSTAPKKSQREFFVQRAEQEGQDGGYIMYKKEIPGTPYDKVPPQVRPNQALVTNYANYRKAETTRDNDKARLEILKKTTPKELVAERRAIVKKAETELKRVKSTTPEKIKADAEKGLKAAESKFAKAKASGDTDAIKQAQKELNSEKRNYKSQIKRANTWDKTTNGFPTSKERDLHDKTVQLKNAQNALERAIANPKESLANAIKSQERKLVKSENRFKKAAAKYVFAPGEKAARMETNPDPQNLKNLTSGKGRIYFAMEGSIKNDAILTAIKKEDPTASVVNVPSVTLWQQKDLPAGQDSEVAWFTKKYAKGREVVLIPDADGVTNEQVTRQAQALESVLRQNGAGEVYLAAPPLKRGRSAGKDAVEEFDLPSGVKEGRKGIDDHLGAGRGTLGQLQFTRVTKKPNIDLSEYSRAIAGKEGMNKSAIKPSEQVLAAISDIVGPKGSGRISNSILASSSGLPKSTAIGVRDRLQRLGLIDIEYVFDPVSARVRRRNRDPRMSDPRLDELVRRGIIDRPDFSDPYEDVDIEYSPIITVRRPEHRIKSEDLAVGSLQEISTWKPPKSFKGWSSSITGRRDSSGLAERVQEASTYNAARNRRRAAKRTIIPVSGAQRRTIATEAGARYYSKLYGIPLQPGDAIPQFDEELQGVSVSLTMGWEPPVQESIFLDTEDLLSFYNKCHDDDGRFCDEDGVDSTSSEPNWPKRGGRKVSKLDVTEADGIRASAIYEVETNGKKIRLYDEAGKVDEAKARDLLNNHARMHEMYPLTPPRGIRVVNPQSIFNRNSPIEGRRDVSIVSSLSPYTYVNANELSFNTKRYRTGWAMHSSQSGNTKNLDYIMTHEYGHHLDFARNSDGYTHRPSPVLQDRRVQGSLSRYGRTNAMEGYAETFAEWHHTYGRTKNPATIAMARYHGWYGTGTQASGALEEETQVSFESLLKFYESGIISFSLLSFDGWEDDGGAIEAAAEEGEAPDERIDLDGIIVVDNFYEEEGPVAINYKAEEPSAEEIARAKSIVDEVLAELDEEASDE